MTQWRRFLHGFLAVLLVFSFISCGNDDYDNNDDSDTNGTPTSVEFPEVVISDVPQNVIQNAPEVVALQAYGASMLAWSAYVTAAGNPIDGGTEWTTVDQFTGDEITVSVVETGSGYIWTVSINDTAISVGEISDDGGSVQWTIYDETGQNVEATYTATTGEDGSQNFELLAADLVYTGAINADGSGWVMLETNGQTSMEVQWNADGTGVRKIYGPDGTVIAEQPF